MIKSTLTNAVKSLGTAASVGAAIASTKSKKNTSDFEADFNKRSADKFKEKQSSPFPDVQNALSGTRDSNQKSSILKTQTKQKPSLPSFNSSTLPKTGTAIKRDIQNVLKNKYGELDTRHIFDGIDDKDIEDNIPAAKNTIKTNVDKGFLGKDFAAKLPNLMGGLALSYAAANKGNNRAATRAREAAYMDAEKLLNTSFEKPKLTNLIGNPNEKSEFTLYSNRSKENLPQNGTRFMEAVQNNSTQQGKAGKRYVNVDNGNLNMRSAPGTNNSVLDKMPRGTEVHFTGNKTTVGDKQWAEIEYGGKKGWVDADYLKIDYPENSVTKSMSVTDTSNRKADYTTNLSTQKRVNWNDYTDLQKAFNEVGDFDGYEGLECPDAVKWFISTQTTLTPESGNGCLQTKKIASQKEDLVTTNVPCAPAVFSVEAGKPGPGVNGNSHPTAGHTGIVLACKELDDGQYEITYFHTYSGLENAANKSAIKTKKVRPSEFVTFVDISKYMK